MESTDPISESTPKKTTPIWIWWGILGLFLLWALVNLNWGRGIAWDEVEFIQATDLIRKGLVPYRDFFEHHTPLSWFLMAPFEALSKGPGTAPIIWLRWVQVPIWATVVWLVNGWMKEDGDPQWARLCAVACLLGTPLFVFSALEYRVDTLGVFFILLGLDQLRRPGVLGQILSGAFLALSVLANLRFAPFVFMVALVMACLDLQRHRWQVQPLRLGRLVFGAALAVLPWLIYMLITGSLSEMWLRCVVQNQAAHQIVGSNKTMGLHLGRPLANADIPGLMLQAGVIYGAWPLLKTIRKPRFMHLVFLAQIANLTFISLMKVHFPYHFELSLCLAVPFLAMALERLASHWDHSGGFQRAIAWVVVLGLVVNASNLTSKNDHRTLKYQDQVLKEASRLAPVDSYVLDGCGWLLGRKPVYKYWFYPMYVRVLSSHHVLEPFSAEEFKRNLPSLVIASIRTANLAAEWSGPGRLIVTHYLPTLPNLWVPGLSSVFTPKRRACEWTVPASGNYRILFGPALYEHPWFKGPFKIVEQDTLVSDRFTIYPEKLSNIGMEELRWELDGQSVVPTNDHLSLKAGSTLSVHFSGEGNTAVMLVREGTGPFFQAAPPGVNLDYISFSDYYRTLP